MSQEISRMDDYAHDVQKLVLAWRAGRPLTSVPLKGFGVRWSFIKPSVLGLKIVDCSPEVMVSITATVRSMGLQIKFTKSHHRFESDIMYCSIFRRSLCC